MDVLTIGTLAFDTVRTPFGAREDALGGSLSYLATAASFFARVGMVGVIGQDFPREHLDFFAARGIDLDGVATLPGETFRWSGRYEENLNVAHTLETKLNVLSEFRPTLSPAARRAGMVVLGNIDPSLQLSVLAKLESPRLVVLDTMNYWIDSERYRPILIEALARVDVLCINDAEARLLSDCKNLVAAARAIRAMGPRILIIKRGEHGASLFTSEGVFSVPGFPLEDVRDPTGAGDSFAGGFVGFLAKHGSIDDRALRTAVVVGCVIASFVVQDFSLDRLRTLTSDEIAARLRAYQDLVRFDAFF